MPGVENLWSRSRWVRRDRRQVGCQGVELEQVGQSAGMHVPQSVVYCKCVKLKGGRSVPTERVCGCALLHGRRSGLKRHG